MYGRAGGTGSSVVCHVGEVHSSGLEVTQDHSMEDQNVMENLKIARNAICTTVQVLILKISVLLQN